MTKKNTGKEIHDGEIVRAELFIDKKTLEIIDAQCEDKNIGRDKFLAAAVRLYLDFNYMAHMVGKDIFAFRDDMIKAIIKSKGDGAAENAGGDANAKTSMSAADPGAANGAVLEEIAGLKKMVLELKEMFASRDREGSRGGDGTASGRHDGERHTEHEPRDARHAKKQHPAPISVEKIAMEFKDSNPPTYKEKRKKLDKLKF